MSEKQIIEIKGVKLEVDLRSARRIEELRCGDRVKILVKSYGNSFAVYAGVITGFDLFPSLPTITVAYIDQGYAGGLKFVSFNSESKDIELVADEDARTLELDKGAVLEQMDRAILTKESEAETLRRQRAFFLARFGAYFSETAKQPAVAGRGAAPE